MKSKFKKIITRLGFPLLIFFLLTSLNIRPASADTFSISDISSIFGGGIASLATGAMDSVLSDLGVNKSALQYGIQTANVAQNKQEAPQVSLSFNPADPVPNQEVTVTATPSYFLNDTRDLYFTWYLQHHDGDGIKSRYDRTLGKNIKCDGEGNCDLNGDGKIDIEDYEIAAMRMIASADFDWQDADYSHSTNHAGYQASFGGNDQAGKESYCYIYDTNSGNEYRLKGDNNGCTEHLFPNAPGHTTGNGHWGLGEEEFWHTDPNSDDTAYTGNPDEANVAGLGINNFSWVYEPGDRVGVAVEGTAINPTTEPDSSYRTMWAFSNNSCDISRFVPDIDKTTGSGADLQYVHQPDSVIDMTIKDITDSCLTDNLVDPTQGGGEAQRLDVNLSYSPQNPMNDSAMQNGDQVTVSSAISNIDNTNPDYFQYQWQVYEADDPNPDSWGSPVDLSNSSSQTPDASPATGLGLDTFSFNLDFKTPPKKFMLVKLTVTQNVGNSGNSGTDLRKGIATVVIPISSTTDQISAYSATVTDSGNAKPQLGVDTDNQLCTDPSDRAICPVAQDSIIGVEVNDPALSDFLWTVNGNPVTLVNNSTTQSNLAYFPALDNNGTRYTVNLAATNLTTGDKVNLTRVFQVADPTVTIATADQDTAQPTLLGYYVDLNGKQWPDYSNRNFQGVSGTTLQFQADFTGWNPPAGAYTWFVNGEPAGSASDTTNSFVNPSGYLDLNATGNTGDSYDVSVGYTYAPSTAIQKALNYYWNVPISQFYSAPVGASAQVTLVDSLTGSSTARANLPPQKILASLYASLPSYLAFLFRVTLTIFVVLFTSGLILSFSAPPREDD